MRSNLTSVLALEHLTSCILLQEVYMPEVAFEFAQPILMCFVDLEKAYDCVPQVVQWGVALGVWGR